MITADILRQIMGTDDLDAHRDWERVSCPYCNGEHHLMVDPVWLVDCEIPRSVDVKDYYLAPIRRGSVYIPCDCKADLKSNPDQRQPRTFREYFFEPIREHWFGRAIMARRQALRDLLDEGVARAKQDRAGGAPVAVDDDVPDPPEHTLDVQDYSFVGGQV